MNEHLSYALKKKLLSWMDEWLFKTQQLKANFWKILTAFPYT